METAVSYSRAMHPRLAAPIAMVLLATVALTACVADTGTSPSNAPTPSPSITSEAGIDASPSSAPTPSPSITSGPVQPDTGQMIADCVAKVSEAGPGPASQFVRSELLSSEVRTAFRPDDLWYLSVPLDDPMAPGDQLDELQCLLTPEGVVDTAFVRAKPAVDDFDLWASAQNYEGGL